MYYLLIRMNYINTKIKLSKTKDLYQVNYNKAKYNQKVLSFKLRKKLTNRTFKSKCF